MRHRSSLTVVVLTTILVVKGRDELVYIKYPSADSFVTSCSLRELVHGSESHLEVRRVIEPRTSKPGQRASSYYADDRPTPELRIGWDGIAHSRADFLKHYGSDSSEWTAAAPLASFYPFDASPQGGWRGDNRIGDRVSFLSFDMRDFSAEALARATLRMTAKEFPLGSVVEVRGACNSDAAAQPFHEQSLTWENAPIISDGDRMLCEWSSDDEIMYPQDEPFECDVSAVARENAGGHLCLTIDMKKLPDNPRDPVVFWSREAFGDPVAEGASRLPQQQALPPFTPDDRTPQPMQARGDARAQRADAHRGSTKRSDPSAAAAGSASSSSLAQGGAPLPPTQQRFGREGRVPGLEFGTVQQRSSGSGALRDSGTSWRPHLVISGSQCGGFADHTATHGCPSP